MGSRGFWLKGRFIGFEGFRVRACKGLGGQRIHGAQGFWGGKRSVDEAYDENAPGLAAMLCQSMTYVDQFSPFLDEALMDQVVDYLLQSRQLQLPKWVEEAFDLEAAQVPGDDPRP